MSQSTKHRNWLTIPAAVLIGLSILSNTGCQMSVAGQTLPSPYYLDDDAEYFAPGPEFKLAREAAAMKAYADGAAGESDDGEYEDYDAP